MIGAGTFVGCPLLTTITIPASVTFIGNLRSDPNTRFWGAFSDCANLHSALFLGNAPTEFDGNTFKYTAPDFTIYYLSTRTGFTSPTWNGYRAVGIDVNQHPAAPWLLEHGFPHDTDLHQDINGDGVTLLMAYALDLDPRENLRSRLPLPVLDGDSLSLTFHSARSGLTYTVQTSTDLQSWTTEGVTTSALDSEGFRTAMVTRDTPRRFLRLVVE